MIRFTLLPLLLTLFVYTSNGEVNFDLLASPSQSEPSSAEDLFYHDLLSSESQAVHVRYRRETAETDEKLRKNKKATGDKPTSDKPPRPKPSRLDELPTSTYTSSGQEASTSGAGFTTPADLPELDGILNPPPANFSLPAQSRDDHHTYYSTSLYTNQESYAKSLWMTPGQGNCTRHSMLSKAHRRAATVTLSFRFPFYGYEIENITIATGGFLFLGEAIHTWLAATQYIAPLMANFNTSISNTSGIYYCDNGTAFTVQWDQTYLQEPTNSNRTEPARPFSFQATLHRSGEIVFVYKDVPIPIDQISEEKHPVKVGISDAYIIERHIIFIRRKTIYEYHKAEMKRKAISDNTVLYFRPLPTCISLKDCQSCLKPNATDFDCGWCESLNRCSDGYDRHRNSWILNKCDSQAADKKCPVPGQQSRDANSSANSPSIVPGESNAASSSATSKQSNRAGSSDASTSGRSGARFGFWSLLFMVSMVGGLAFWSLYAYKNPHSSSGQFLIKYRPTQWKFGPNDA
jgi:hypothetical protein